MYSAPNSSADPKENSGASYTATMEIESDSDDDVTGADLSHTSCILKDYVLLKPLVRGDSAAYARYPGSTIQVEKKSTLH